jgi:MoxR-like ATPase
MMRKIISVHFPNLNKDLATACLEAFYQLREVRGVEKKPATRELINWMRALQADADFNIKSLKSSDIPYLGVLFKKSTDLFLAAHR